MSKVTENVQKVLDPEKLKKKGLDLVGLMLGIGVGAIVTNVLRGKLPMAKIMEPLATIIPGISGSILIEDSFWRSSAMGLAAVGALDGADKVVKAVPFLGPVASVVPKVTNSKTPPNVAGLRGLGNLNENKAVLLGLSGGSQVVQPWM